MFLGSLGLTPELVPETGAVCPPGKGATYQARQLG